MKLVEKPFLTVSVRMLPSEPLARFRGLILWDLFTMGLLYVTAHVCQEKNENGDRIFCFTFLTAHV